MKHHIFEPSPLPSTRGSQKVGVKPHEGPAFVGIIFLCPRIELIDEYSKNYKRKSSNLFCFTFFLLLQRFDKLSKSEIVEEGRENIYSVLPSSLK